MLSDVLRQYWGYDAFLPLQEEAMTAVIEGRDSVVILSTGGGKSLCYQATALCMSGMAVIVSPLISLMKDQVDALRSCGIAAAYINSSLTPLERKSVADEVREGKLKLLYIAPERLVQERTIEFLKNANISFIAIDEAHCISEWGHDFRPEYREMKLLRTAFPHLGLHAYTATATPRVRQDIAEQLQLRDPEMLVGSFDRPNLIYRVSRRAGGLSQMTEVMERHRGEAGIVYCVSRKEVEETHLSLNALGHKTLPYHAGLSDEMRHRHQDAFQEEEVDIIVATVAFGMGIDKSNVRYVIHQGMPKSLEAYQQESGRAGRDGLAAECCLFYSAGDIVRWKRMMEGSDPQVLAAAHGSLDAMYSFCTRAGCRHQALSRFFGQELPGESCNACDICLGDVEMVPEALIIAQKILSSVIRQQERFGGEYTTLVLKGSQDQRVLQNGHDKLSTYGLLAHEDQRSIRDWIEQLVGQEFLEKVGEYNVLQVTPTGRQLLRGKLTPRLLQPTTPARKASRRSVEEDSWEGVDHGLFEDLRTLRREQALKLNVPPYIVFGDTALRDMARIRPTSLATFQQVKGVGAQKLANFGELFVTRISDYCRRHQLTINVLPIQKTSASASATTRRDEPALPGSANLAAPHFRTGKSVEDVAQLIGRAPSTVRGYLQQYLLQERITDPTPWVPPGKVQLVHTALQHVEGERLKPIFDFLKGTVSYDEIRVVLTCLKCAAGEVKGSHI